MPRRVHAHDSSFLWAYTKIETPAAPPAVDSIERCLQLLPVIGQDYQVISIQQRCHRWARGASKPDARAAPLHVRDEAVDNQTEKKGAEDTALTYSIRVAPRGGCLAIDTHAAPPIRN